jgi:hypothetical protein
VRGSVKPSIGEALAFNTLQRDHVRDVERVGQAVAVYERQYGLLLRLFLRKGAVLFLAAYECLVRLNDLVFAADRAGLART